MAQATTSKTAADSTTQTTTSTTVSPATEMLVIEKPIVYERKRKKSRKRKKYSKGLKETQQLEVDATRAANRIADAVADGIGKYRRERDKSARKRRDGAIKDVVRNLGRGLSEGLDKAARAPSDLTRRATAKRLSRMFPLPPPPFSYFMRGR